MTKRRLKKLLMGGRWKTPEGTPVLCSRDAAEFLVEAIHEAGLPYELFKDGCMDGFEIEVGHD